MDMRYPFLVWLVALKMEYRCGVYLLDSFLNCKRFVHLPTCLMPREFFVLLAKTFQFSASLSWWISVMFATASSMSQHLFAAYSEELARKDHD